MLECLLLPHNFVNAFGDFATPLQLTAIPLDSVTDCKDRNKSAVHGVSYSCESG